MSDVPISQQKYIHNFEKTNRQFMHNDKCVEDSLICYSFPLLLALT